MSWLYNLGFKMWSRVKRKRSISKEVDLRIEAIFGPDWPQKSGYHYEVWMLIEWFQGKMTTLCDRTAIQAELKRRYDDLGAKYGVLGTLEDHLRYFTTKPDDEWREQEREKKTYNSVRKCLE